MNLITVNITRAKRALQAATGHWVRCVYYMLTLRLTRAHHHALAFKHYIELSELSLRRATWLKKLASQGATP